MRAVDLSIDIFADTADLATIIDLHTHSPFIQGYTTNPTLMRRAGVTNYEEFAHRLLEAVPNKSISLQVFSDNLDEMYRQARKINSWANKVGHPSVYVKIPITNSLGISTEPVIQSLSAMGVKLNITAVFTAHQASIASRALGKTDSYISLFAGRIADTGKDPSHIVRNIATIIKRGNQKLLWGGTRSVYNVIEADQSGADIVTVTPEVLAKLHLIGKGLGNYSLETIQMFKNDADICGYKISDPIDRPTT